MTIAPLLPLLSDVWRRLRWQGPALLALLVGTSLTEGVALALLFPLLTIFGIGSTGSDSTPITTLTAKIFSLAGLPLSLSSVLLLLAGAVVAQNLLFTLQARVAAEYQHRYVLSWREDLFRSFLQAKWRNFVDNRASDLTNALLRETNRLSGAAYLLTQVVCSLVYMAVYLALALLASWQVAAALVFFGAVMLLATRPLVRRGIGIGREITRCNEDMQANANDFFYGAKLLKATGTEQSAMDIFNRSARDAYRFDVWGSFHPNLLKAVYEICAIVLLCGMIGSAVHMLNINTAAILISIYMFLRLYSRFSALQQNMQVLNLQLSAFDSASAYLAQARAAAENTRAGNPYTADGPAGISLREVRVEWSGSQILCGVSLDIAPGEVLALVGESGAGKSTLVDVLLLLAEPSSGEVLVNGAPLSGLALEDWRRSVGYVTQDTLMFHASVRENIAWGRPGCTEAEIVEAARKAHAHEFISALPEGYATVVGDQGSRLSGGQRQRIGLARALLAARSLLILDEPTSALDAESELQVMRAIEALGSGMTTVIVAHRLSTIRNAHKIAVMSRGRIIEMGGWDELLAKGGAFRDLWLKQAAPAGVED